MERPGTIILKLNSTTKKYHLTNQIKKHASKLGFLDCAISKAKKLEEEESRLSDWLKKDMHGEMHFMENHFEKRLDPTKLFEGTKSVISLLYNYYTGQKPEEDHYKISKYAYGEDYHHVIKSKLKLLIQYIEKVITGAKCRAFIDSAPVLDKVWAKKSGLGWIGKNTNLISRKHGSFFFIAEIMIDAKLDYGIPIKDYCGQCTKCIDACPTNAIYEPYKVDANKCISYFTIELKNLIPQKFKGKYNNWIFGCDICQDVCPWNSKLIPHLEAAFEPHPDLLKMKKEDWENIDEKTFQKIFKNSAVKRTKFTGLKRNIKFLKS